jgi:non-specific serine/threonine protein kinase/serine/threonine-protein kinase
VADPEFWSRVDEVFIAAVELEGDAAARAALVEARCAGDDALLAEERALLAAHDQSGGFLGPARRDTPADAATLGTVVGAYRLTAKIGEGGMGDVYRAERADGLFGHAVALKVTRSSLIDPAAAARFATERQILATLQHPHIVTLLDGGTLADGRAYLVMELVDGVPITKYCADRTLGLEARLALFRQVCAAAHYAHRHAIVHRDLKPANVLVTADGTAKVLDFGVAKLLAAEAGAGQTVPGLMPGPLTPNYASPEQLRGLPVTTASDVYALGVLLYELITGTRPYETAGQPLDTVIDLVVRTEPPRPSRAPAGADGPLSWDRRRVRGDLDAIVLKALAKDPEARYASAEQLADDVARFVDRQPVTAREPSPWYVLRKLASRHRVAAIAGGLAIAAVVTGLAVALWQRHEAERERRLAEARFTQVRGLANALIFKIHDAIVPLPGSTPVRKTIVAEALRYLEALQHDAGSDYLLRFELAGAYIKIASVLGDPNNPNVGDRAGAIAALLKAEALIAAQAHHPKAPLDTVARYLSIQNQLAALYRITGKPAEAHAANDAALALAEAVYARNPGAWRSRELLANAIFNVAWSGSGGAWRQGAPLTAAETMRLWSRARELYQQVLAEQPDNLQRMRNLALTEKYLGSLAQQIGERADGIPYFERALALDERRLAANPGDRQARFDVAIDLANTASGLEGRHDYERSIPMRLRSIEMRRALAAADPQDVQLKNRLSHALQGVAAVEMHLPAHLSDAAAHAQEALAIARETLKAAPDAVSRVQLADSLATLAGIQARQGHRAVACRGFRNAQAEFDRTAATGDEREYTRQSLATTCAAP